MQTKSNIQLIIENIDIKNKFLNEIKKLCESYNILDNIFVYNRGIKELTGGYFVPVQEGSINDLPKFISDMNISNQGIRINENKIQLGDLYNKIPADKSFVEIKCIK